MRRRDAAQPIRELPESERPQPVAYLPPLPAGPAKRSYGTLISFVVCVLVPIAVAALYYCKIASEQYVTEFRFAVKDTSASASAAAASSLMSFFGGSGSADPNDNYLVADYLTSREAVEELQSRINVEGMYSRRSIDWWSRFDASKPMEDFVQYWQKRVTSSYDQVTGLAVAQVRAFTPEDSYLIAKTLVQLSEELINGIATRTATDSVKFAANEVEKAQNRVKASRAKMTDFRNRVGVIDPTASVVASNSALAQTLRAGLAQLETSLATMLQRHLTRTAPAVVSLQTQIKATKDQLSQLESGVGQSTGGAALSTIVGEYEQLNLEYTFASTMLTSAMQALDQARANAATQHLYITPYVRPSKPQSSTYPNKPLSIAVVGLLAFIIWTIGLLFIRATREHFA